MQDSLRQSMNRPSDKPRFLRSFTDEQAIALSAMDCVLNSETAIYASSEITTGRRFYDLLKHAEPKTPDDLDQLIRDEEFRRPLMETNVIRARTFARLVRRRSHGSAPVVSPGPLIAPEWNQRHYLSFWGTFIRTRAHAAHFNEDWEFSRGCTFEFLTALDARLPTFDYTGSPLDLDEGIRLIEKAIRNVELQNVPPVGLRENLKALKRLRRSMEEA